MVNAGLTESIHLLSYLLILFMVDESAAYGSKTGNKTAGGGRIRNLLPPINLCVFGWGELE